MHTRHTRPGPAIRLLFGVLCTFGFAACGPNPNVATQHNDNFRTGAYLAETLLRPDAVRNRGMHVRYWVPPCWTPPREPYNASPRVGCLDGAIVTQPLYVNGVRFERHWLDGGGTVNAPGVFVATTNNVVHAFDADTGQPMWTTDLKVGLSGLSKWISATPVIDVAKNRMYVVFAMKNQEQDLPVCEARVDPNLKKRDETLRLAASLVVRYFIAKIDLSSGNTVLVQPIVADYQRRDGSRVSFVGKHQVNHPALLLHQGSVYVAFGSPAWSEGCVEFHGWVMRYDALNLQRQGVFNTSPDKTDVGSGAGIWQGGGGLAAVGDSVYFLTGDGLADRTPELVRAGTYLYTSRRRFYGDAFIKLRPSGSSFQAFWYFPPGAEQLQKHDADLGSGGALIVPDSDIVLGGGKSGLIYLLKRSSMAEHEIFDGTTNQFNPALRGETWDKGPHLHGSPTYWASSARGSGFLYLWGEKDVLRQYQFNKSTQAIDPKTPVRQGSVRALWNVMPGGMLSLSADGNKAKSAVLWGTLPMGDRPNPYPGGLYAFDAENLNYLWSARYNTVAHWVPPTIAAGKVFLAEGDPFRAGSEKLTVFELGRGGADRAPTPIQPAQSTCKTCHVSNLATVTAGMEMSAHHATGGSVRMKPGLTLAMVSPPSHYRLSSVLQGTGIRTFEARPDTAAKGALLWAVRDTTADLTDAAAPDPSGGAEGTAAATKAAAEKPAVRVTLSQGTIWTASDGSEVTGELDHSAPAPEDFDGEWALFRATRSSDRGLLGGVTYIQQVYTHAGRPPTKPPQKSGETARVPFLAEYWLYR